MFYELVPESDIGLGGYGYDKTLETADPHYQGSHYIARDAERESWNTIDCESTMEQARGPVREGIPEVDHIETQGNR